MAGRLMGYGLGEVVDRLSVLTLKMFHKSTPEYDEERAQLARRLLDMGPVDKDIVELFLALAAINGELWGHEDQIRRFRASRDYDQKTVLQVAFEIQELNDRRAALIAHINGATS